jgi:hypothetical protein
MEDALSRPFRADASFTAYLGLRSFHSLDLGYVESGRWPSAQHIPVPLLLRTNSRITSLETQWTGTSNLENIIAQPFFRDLE